MITLTSDEQALVRFKVDSRVKEADLPISILTALSEEAENALKLRLETVYSSLTVAAQAFYRSAVINLTAALALASFRPQVSQRAGPVTVQWADGEREKRLQELLDLYEANVAELVELGHGAEGSGTGLAFACLF